MYIVSGTGKNGKVWAYAVNSVSVVDGDVLLELATDSVFKYVFVPMQSIRFDSVGAFFRRYSNLADFSHVRDKSYSVEFWTEGGGYRGCVVGSIEGCIDSYLKKINS